MAVSGICGLVMRQQSEQVRPDHLAPMLQALGQEVAGGRQLYLGAVALGTRGFAGRIADGAQMTVHASPLAIVVHGSLYNRRELLAAGRHEESLPQALLALYLREGMDFVKRLRGEFVLGLWDGGRETLFLVTDRFRVHPLFYYHDATTLVFASRMRSLCACPLPMEHTMRPEAIADLLAWSAIPTPHTIFREVYKMPAGSILCARRGALQITPYWEINFLQPERAAEAVLARRLKATFAEALAVQLAEDAAPDRVGTFLSGGVDSSTVTGVMTQVLQRPIKSFSIGFSEQRFNEIEYARIAAQAFGAEHYEYFVSPKDTYDALPILLEELDEPYGNASAVPAYFCAKMAQEHGVSRLYAGDGGDELFAGNERYAEQRLFEYYAQLPRWLRQACVSPAVNLLADTLHWPLLVKGQKYIRRANIPSAERLFSYGVFHALPMDELFTDDLLVAMGRAYNPYAIGLQHYQNAPARSELDRQLYLDLRQTITDNDLLKVTRMTEAAGVAVRYPFLDHQVAEFAALVPARVKMRGRQLRSFFKRAYTDVLPLAIRTKPKHGFGLPIPVWLRTDTALHDMMHDLILSPQSLQRGYFRKQTLEALIQNHAVDTTSFYGTILWYLMMLELWHRTSTARVAQPSLR